MPVSRHLEITRCNRCADALFAHGEKHENGDVSKCLVACMREMRVILIRDEEIHHIDTPVPIPEWCPLPVPE